MAGVDNGEPSLFGTNAPRFPILNKFPDRELRCCGVTNDSVKFGRSVLGFCQRIRELEPVVSLIGDSRSSEVKRPCESVVSIVFAPPRKPWRNEGPIEDICAYPFVHAAQRRIEGGRQLAKEG